MVGADVVRCAPSSQKSLLRHTSGRFWMLETIRDYAAEELEKLSDADDLRRCLLDWLVGLAETARPHLIRADQGHWLTRLESERGNIRAALSWAFDGPEPELALRLTAALRRFWWIRGPAEGLTWLERGLAQPAIPLDVHEAALDAAGNAAYIIGDAERSLRLYEEGLARFREAGDRAGTAKMLRGRAFPLLALGDLAGSEQSAAEALAISRELQERDEVMFCLNALAAVASERGELDRVEELEREELALARELGSAWDLVPPLVNLAEVAMLRGDAESAWSLAQEAFAAAREVGDANYTLAALNILSIAAARQGRPRAAGALWGVGERLDLELGESRLAHSERRRLEEMLGERAPEFERGVEEGRRLSPDDAVALATASP